MEFALRQPVSDGAILTRSLEHIVRAMIRLLVGRLSLVRLEELVRKIYVQESEKRLKSDFPGKRVTLSQLALMTGIDTRALTKITNSPSYTQPAHEDQAFLRGMTPETQILSLWSTDPRFCDSTDGKPRVLSLDKGESSFAELVSCLKSTRGLTHQSVLERLAMAGTVEVDRQWKRVTLKSDTYYPFISNNEPSMLDAGFGAASLLLGTVAKNIERTRTGGERLFQRSWFSYRLSPKKIPELRQRLGKLLSKAEDEFKANIAEVEDSAPRPDHVFAGVGMFYFEAEDPI